MASVRAYADALRLLAGRELSVAETRTRLLGRDHPPDDVEAALARLLEEGSLDDARVARTYVRTAATVKGRGRQRIDRELREKGIDRDVATAAVAEVFGDLDERALMARAVEKKLRGRRPVDAAGWARLYQYLMRQGFSPALVSAELRRLRKGEAEDTD